ncbi:MAG: flagellar export protein FliJ [Desulfobulbaceae bacterium]|uniref:Flagellar FliJ protein n=1 Tax=Candidatus Desulfobia pelagia TaxID=2841692 RepID=A0A8J6TDB3_9BACT|nr:flagellar export protein FliJ [Candidatus Desulfobia pelagia]
MPFHFKLESVLTVRKNLEEQLQFRLTREQMMLNGHRTHLVDLESRRQDIIAEFEECKKKTLSGARFGYFMDSIRIKEEQIRVQQNTVKSQEQVVDEARKKLSGAMQQRKIVEVIREKQMKDYLAVLRKKEETENDEQVVLRYGRANKL